MAVRPVDSADGMTAERARLRPVGRTIAAEGGRGSIPWSEDAGSIRRIPRTERFRKSHAPFLAIGHEGQTARFPALETRGLIIRARTLRPQRSREGLAGAGRT